ITASKLNDFRLAFRDEERHCRIPKEKYRRTDKEPVAGFQRQAAEKTPADTAGPSGAAGLPHKGCDAAAANGFRKQSTVYAKTAGSQTQQRDFPADIPDAQECGNSLRKYGRHGGAGDPKAKKSDKYNVQPEIQH